MTQQRIHSHDCDVRAHVRILFWLGQTQALHAARMLRELLI
jgi:hypothetical protein